MCRYSLIIFILGLGQTGYGQFVKNHDVSNSLPDLSASTIAWGDFDNDGDQDLALAGTSGVIRSYIYRNDDGQFVNTGAEITPVTEGSLDWGDFDNDGDLDLLLSGLTEVGVGTERVTFSVTKIFRNDNGVFVDHNAGLQGVYAGTIQWGDFDNDNALDIALTGAVDEVGQNDILKVYHNETGTFIEVTLAVQPNGSSLKGTVSWGDFDGDLDLDLLVTGMGTNLAGDDLVTMVLRNDDGTFVDTGMELVGIASGHGVWCDYNKDGDLDLALSGVTFDGTYTSVIYENVANVFSDIGAPLENMGNSYMAWADYDNDNDIDLIISGISGDTFAPSLKLYNNDGGVFTETNIPIPDVWAEMDWTDYNDDNFPDLVLTGLDVAYNAITAVYENFPGPNQKILYESINGKTYGDLDFELTASSSSGLPLEYFLISGPATLDNRTVSITGAGEIAIEILQAGNEDFNIESELMIITVNKKELKAIADDKSMTYGDPLPEFTLSYDGFVNGENQEILVEEPIMASLATVDSDAGNYDITLSGGQSVNYNFVRINGVLSITKALAIVTLSEVEHIFDGTQKTVKVTTAPEGLSYKAIYDGDINAPSQVGMYEVQVTLDDQNYAGETTGTLTIQLISSRDSEIEYPRIEVYPIPATDNFNLIGELKNLRRITLHNLSGKVVLDELMAEQKQFDVSQLPAGLYILSLMDQNGKRKTQTLLIK